MKNYFLPTIFIIGLAACGGFSEFENAATENYSREDQQKFARYMVEGKKLYTANCSNCHQEDGSGLGKLIPPLAKADYLLENQERAICIIKNGIKEEIIVNGTAYRQPMIGFSELAPLDIAMISTYIYNSWGAETGFITQEQVKAALQQCNKSTY